MDNGGASENGIMGFQEPRISSALFEKLAAEERARRIEAERLQKLASPLDTTERKRGFGKRQRLERAWGNPTPEISFTATLEEAGDPIRVAASGDVKIRLMAFADQLPNVLQLLALADQPFRVTITPE